MTLLGRRLAEQGRIPVRDAVFAETRNNREWQLTQLLGRHASLLEIHESVADALSVDPAQASAWVRAEQDLERELTVPVPGARERLEEARRDGTVVFVSDTPHSAEFIGELLALHELVPPRRASLHLLRHGCQQVARRPVQRGRGRDRHRPRVPAQRRQPPQRPGRRSRRGVGGYARATRRAQPLRDRSWRTTRGAPTGSPRGGRARHGSRGSRQSSARVADPRGRGRGRRAGPAEHGLRALGGGARASCRHRVGSTTWLATGSR